MIAAAPSTNISSVEEDSKPGTLLSNMPKKDSLMEFEKKLKAAEQQVKPTPAPSPAVATTVPAKNALLARVQAAQQRARMAQEKQKRAKQEQDQILIDLVDSQSNTAAVTESAPLKQEESQIFAPKDPPPLVEKTPKPSLLDEQNTPSFAVPPPAADLLTFTPSAPPIAQEQQPKYSSLLPLAPPPATTTSTTTTTAAEAPPPSFEQFESEVIPGNDIDDTAFGLDMDGNEMTPEQRMEMIREQERILKAIKEENDANAAAIAAATAEDYGHGPMQAHESVPANATAAVASASGGGANAQTVEIAPNKRVALHGQDRTKEAIANGTAVLVQCMNCQNWMQVTPTATLMFCPVCQVVSPVKHQSSVWTKEEAVQMSLDRKLAEKIQNEEWAAQEQSNGNAGGEEEEGFLSTFKAAVFGSSSNAATGVPSGNPNTLQGNTAQAQKSWSEYLSSLISSSSAEEDSAPQRRSAEIVVGRKAHPLQRGAASSSKPSAVNIYGDDTEEIDFNNQGGGGDEQSSLLGPGLVADNNKPLFSCVVESMSSMLSGQTDVPQGKLHGVDTSSLLSVTEVGRKKGGDDGRGTYSGLSSS